MSVSNAPNVDRNVAQFIQKMNALGLTPLVDINEEHALIAFSLKEFLAGMKRSLIKSGVPEDKLTIEVVPYGNDKYIKVLVRKR
jgi:hypothetical protein